MSNPGAGFIADSPLRWHVCPQCGLAGWAREGRGYCHLRSGQLEESPFGERPLTEIERMLGRKIFTEPPSLSACQAFRRLQQDHARGMG